MCDTLCAACLQLEEAKVPVKQMKHNPAKLQPVTPALQALLSKDQELKVVGSGEGSREGHVLWMGVRLRC